MRALMVFAMMTASWAHAEQPAVTIHAQDGEQKLYLKSGYVAEFPKKKDKTAKVESKVQDLDADAELVPMKTKGPRIWKLKSSSVKSRISKKSQDNPLPPNSSPVFTETPSGGRLVAFPGGVIVYFQTNLKESEIQDFLRSKNLEVESKLSYAPNAYLIKSEAGFKSVELADELRADARVVVAKPNTWTEHGHR